MLVISGTTILEHVARAQDGAPVAEAKPYRLNATYYSEFWRNVHGGQGTGFSYLDKLDLSAGADAGPLFGLDGLTVFTRAFYANGHGLSSRLTGDNQGVSSIEAARQFRIFELWCEWRLSMNSSARFGLYDLNSEFDTLPTAAMFVNASQGIGRDISQSGRMGPSIYPMSSLGVRSIWQVAPQWIAQAAILDGVPGNPNHPTDTTVCISRKNGALLVGEAGYSNDVIHKIGLGAWHYISNFDTVGTGTYTTRSVPYSGNTGVYGLLDLTLARVPGEIASKLDGFVRLGYADPNVNRFGSFVGAGLVYTGFMKQDDRFGLGLAMARNGSPYLQAALLAGSPQTAAETDIEASWTIPVNPWLTLQPDLQYVINPNTDSTIQNDLVAGLRVTISWDTSPGS